MTHTREARQWRALALAAAGAVGLLTVRVLLSRDVPLVRRAQALWGSVADESDLFGETPAQQTMRRLEACEIHLADMEERFGTVANWWYGEEPCGRRHR